MSYPKINTLWKREISNNERKGCIIEGDFSCPEFMQITDWHITEKIDGTNIRIMIWDGEIEFKGKTNDAVIPAFLLSYLEKTFTKKMIENKFSDALNVKLYGEGYGNKIQSGKKYRDDNSFILFDVWIDGWWLEPENVKKLAGELGIDYVPELGIMTKQEAIKLVKNGFQSRITKEPLNAEGIVARSYPLMLFRNGNPLMWKLKTEDYVKLAQRVKA